MGMVDGSTAAVSGLVSLERALAVCQEEVRKSVAYAEGISTEASDYHLRRDQSYDRALAFLKMTAKVGLALAKLKGEHTSNISIRKTEVQVLPPSAKADLRRRQAVRFEPPRSGRTEKEIAAEWMQAHGMKPGDDWPRLHSDPDDAEDQEADDLTEPLPVAHAIPGATSFTGGRAATEDVVRDAGVEEDRGAPQNIGGSNSGK